LDLLSDQLNCNICFALTFIDPTKRCLKLIMTGNIYGTACGTS